MKQIIFLNGTSQSIAKGINLVQTDGLNIKIKIPDYYPEHDQCFDTWFTSTSGQHTLTVSSFSTSIFTKNDAEIKPRDSYLFWDNGSKERTLKIDNYIITKSDTADNKKYVYFRTVYDVATEKEFVIQIKANFLIDNVSGSLDKKLSISKRHRLTWNNFRAH